MSYTDVHTAASPWEYCDYDARVPGAGTIAATFYAYGQLLLNDQRVYGPTQSEGTYQWLYAGLASPAATAGCTPMSTCSPIRSTSPSRSPNSIRSECDYGMGYTPFYIEQLDRDWQKSPKRRDYLDLFLATTIAYGNMGWLADRLQGRARSDTEAMTRSYYMMQQLQQQYAFVRPAKIEYADQAGRLLTPSEAHATGAMEGSRLHVVYENGTEVFVNRGPWGSWTVNGLHGESETLPSSGWLVFNPKTSFYEFSANAGGRRIDYVLANEYEFLDGRGARTEHGNLAAAGSVVLRRKGNGLELIDIYGNDRIAFHADRTGTLTAFDPDDKPLGKVELKVSGRWTEFRPLPGARSYRFE